MPVSGIGERTLQVPRRVIDRAEDDGREVEVGGEPAAMLKDDDILNRSAQARHGVSAISAQACVMRSAGNQCTHDYRKGFPEMDSEKKDIKITARLRVARYRATHRRIDYVPSPDALVVIERHLAAGMDNCIAAALDMLIVAGDKAISGNN